MYNNKNFKFKKKLDSIIVLGINNKIINFIIE